MTEEELNAQVYDKMLAEQQEFRDHLLSLSPEEILDNAYEYTIREDILLTMEEEVLSPSE